MMLDPDREPIVNLTSGLMLNDKAKSFPDSVRESVATVQNLSVYLTRRGGCAACKPAPEPEPEPVLAPFTCADMPALGAPSAAACRTWLACALLSSASAARSSRRRRSQSSSALAVPPT